MEIRELKPEELRNECNPEVFPFETTDDLPLKEGIIAQDRAIKAIEFGLNIKSEGFNLYISGVPGTGRNTAIIRAVKKIAEKEPVPEDTCYLYNFQKPDEPKALKLPAGKGCQFQKDVEDLIRDLEIGIQRTFTSEEYEKNKKEIVDRFEKLKEALTSELEEFAKFKGFQIEHTLTGLVVVPVYEGHTLKEEEYEKLPEEKKREIEKEQKVVYEKLYDYLRKIRELQKEIKQEIEGLDKKIVLYAVGHLIEEAKKKYTDYELIQKHLGDIQEDILKNIDELKREEEPTQLTLLEVRPPKEQILNRYRVNLLIDNSNTKGAPVIVEHSPTYYNLVGRIEYKARFGVLTTDFTMIKPGSAHKANGGYLIIQVLDLLRDYFAWDALKRIIKYGVVKIEELAERYGLVSTAGLKPEPLPINLKIILVGNPLFYHLLYIYDEDFGKLFKVKADFDILVKRSEDFLQQYAYFIASKCKEERLLPFKKGAVAEIINLSSRLISHKEKLTTRFIEIVDIMREANYWAKTEGAKFVEAEHINKAIGEKIYRSNMIEKKIQELIEENTIFIDTDGRKVGQVNGISVMELGDYTFGKPSRITASTYLGKGEIINIEREAKMSGRIHSKGILILSGYLGEKFAQDKPLALSASICFEQLYDEVEGDSASSTELYCLLSSIAEVPLRQDVAVTGSVDQKGQIQPIGAVNEKIEGFFAVCKIKGLTGKQGVMIPRANVKNLMLKEEIVQAVKEGKFHIRAVENIDEGIEILTGMEAGSFNRLINEKLGRYAQLAIKYKETEKRGGEKNASSTG